MSTLQYVMIAVWVVIIILLVFTVGAAQGDAFTGLELLASFIIGVAFYAGAIALVWYTVKAILTAVYT